MKIVILWNEYTIDKELGSITFPIEEIDKEKREGTTLTISGLRDGWTIAAIKRVYRYVLDLFQPNYLSDRSKKHNSAIQNEESFKVNFSQNREVLINEQISIFEKALAVFEGYIDNQHKGTVHIKSEGLKIDDIIDIEYNKKNEDGNIVEKYYSNLEDVHFKIHYFIYSRPQYYGGKITNLELNGIQEMAKTASGVRLYRNGFRVLPYGEPTDDWTNIDRRWASESGFVNVPLNNKNLYGFVEITDPDGNLFEETASREGLIENEAFLQLSDFLHKSLVSARQRVSEGVTLFREQSDNIEDSVEDSEEKQRSTEEKLKELENLVENLEDTEDDSEENASTNQSTAEEEEKKEKKKAQRKRLVASIRKEIEEASMLRVLAGMGLTIGEFSHEVKQFQPSIYGYISQLKEEKLTENGIVQLDGITHNLNNLIAYTAYFNATVSQNINRETEPIDVLAVLDSFERTITNDLLKSNIEFNVDVWDYDAITLPMHKSEWSSILFNLYTNAKKAINRAQQQDGEIFIEVGIENDNVFLNFYDNGDGIPIENRSRVFNAFFTTSTPAGFDAPRNEQLVGSGLGLKIVKDIVLSYKGKIYVADPIEGFATCIRVEIPRLKQ